MSAVEQDNDDRTYRIAYDVDSDRFFRHSCDACGLDFKLATEPTQSLPMLTPPLERRFNVKPVAPHDDIDDEPSQLTCPYCGHTTRQQNMHTAEHMTYGTKLVQREFLKEVRRLFGSPTGSQATRTLFGDMINAATSPRSVQPIIGPELPDMRIVRLLCCGKSVKVLSHWLDLVYCPYCSHRAVLL